MEPLSGDDPGQVAGYQLRARLGAGGMGRVYLAYTPSGQPVALKIVRPEFGADPVFRERFRHEVDAARRVRGPYIAQVLDFDSDAMPPWLVTDYVPGPSLHQTIAQYGPMPPDSVFRLMAGVAEALRAIHDAGVVHRDLKPSNVLLPADGPRVTDFGIARPAEASVIAQDGTRIGFMAPEQIRGLPPAPALDVFALGHLAAYAALGRSPFAGGDTAAVVARILSQPPDLGSCPQPLRGLIERCLDKDPGARPAPADVVAACRAYQSSPGAATWLPPTVTGAPAQPAAPPPPPLPPPPVQYAPQASPLPPVPAGPHPAQPRPGIYIPRPTVAQAGIAAAVVGALVALGVVFLLGRSSAGSAAPKSSSTLAAGLGRQTAGTSGSTGAAPASPSPASGIDSCVVGTWAGTSQIVPVVIGEPAALTGPGPKQVVLRQDGTGSISYGSGVTFGATVYGHAWTEVVAGGATYNYQTSNGSLLFSNEHGSGTQTLYVDGIRNVSGPLTGSTSVKYVCSGNSLKLYSQTGTGSTELTRTS